MKHRSWKLPILASAILFIVSLAIYGFARWRTPSDEELTNLYRVAYSNQTITNFTGPVVEASIASVPKNQKPVFSRIVPRDWTRKRTPTGILGKVRVFVVGKKDGGFFEIAYTYNPSTEDFQVLHISSPSST